MPLSDAIPAIRCQSEMASGRRQATSGGFVGGQSDRPDTRRIVATSTPLIIGVAAKTPAKSMGAWRATWRALRSAHQSPGPRTTQVKTQGGDRPKAKDQPRSFIDPELPVVACCPDPSLGTLCVPPLPV